MLTEEEILFKLDNYQLGYYCQFIDLGHVYSYLIDCRLNIFRSDNEQWAIAAERLGYNPRGAGIILEIYYFGNCLINLENYNNQDINNYAISPVNEDSFAETIDGEGLAKNAQNWLIRNDYVKLSQTQKDYANAGIELDDYQPGVIPIKAVGRLLVTTHRDLFRATDEELYKSIPQNLQKILVLNEWYHRDFNEIVPPALSDEQLRLTYELNKKLVNDQYPVTFEDFVALYRQQEQTTNDYNNQLENSRPSSYETWQLIAKVIATGDVSLYKPTLAPNTNWKNWPESGSM